ncbi:TetR/AcrR family transcriptional regulator [Cobetia marina]
MNVATASPRRKELVRIAARLFVEEGFDRTTVRMLAQEMGIKSGSLFHHFADKQEILCAVIEEGMFSALAIAREHLARLEAGSAPHHGISRRESACWHWRGRIWKPC